jgi:hypothetical protein
VSQTSYHTHEQYQAIAIQSDLGADAGCQRAGGELAAPPRPVNLAFGEKGETTMLRTPFTLVCAVVLSVSSSHAQDENRARSIEQDKKLLTASKWQNENPEAAWNELSDEHKMQLGGKPWKKVELEIMKLEDSPDSQGRTHNVRLSFFKPDDETFSFGTTPVEVREAKGKRFLVVTNPDKVEYKIEYEFKGDKLQMRGSYLRRELSSGAIFIPEVFDGEYNAIPLKKK